MLENVTHISYLFLCYDTRRYYFSKFDKTKNTKYPLPTAKEQNFETLSNMLSLGIDLKTELIVSEEKWFQETTRAEGDEAYGPSHATQGEKE